MSDKEKVQSKVELWPIIRDEDGNQVLDSPVVQIRISAEIILLCWTNETAFRELVSDSVVDWLKDSFTKEHIEKRVATTIKLREKENATKEGLHNEQ